MLSSNNQLSFLAWLMILSTRFGSPQCDRRFIGAYRF